MASRKAPMPVAERAKQFMAFDALTGLRDLLKERERITVERVELSEESRDELDYVMQKLKVQDMVRVVYFEQDEYVEMKGMVARIDETAHLIKVVNKKIKFEDIYQLELLDF